jgi:hypothetical protein
MFLVQSISLLILTKFAFGQNLNFQTKQYYDAVDIIKIQEAAAKMGTALVTMVALECAPKLDFTKCTEPMAKDPPTNIDSGCCAFGNLIKCYDDVVKAAGCDQKETQKFLDSTKDIIHEMGRNTCKGHSMCYSSKNLCIGWFYFLFCFE